MVDDETKERVYMQYCQSFDFEIAVLQLNLTNEQQDELLNDEDFMFRLRLEDAELKTEIMTSLRGLARSENEGIQMRATLELGNIVYGKRFKGNGQKLVVEDNRPTQVVLVGKGTEANDTDS